MNTKRTFAIGLATVWLFGAHLGGHEHAYVVGVIVSNIWLAAALLLGNRKLT